MQQAIAICGHICSGKSEIISFLSQNYGWNVISFGSYVKQVANAEHLPATRDSYQALGQKLFEERGPKKFLIDVIEFHNPTLSTHLFDGVRHTSIISELREMYVSLFVIYLQVKDAVRYERFLKRRKDHEPLLLFSEFLKLSEHPIEKGISAIAHIADQSIDASAPFEEVRTEITRFLERQNLLK